MFKMTKEDIDEVIGCLVPSATYTEDGHKEKQPSYFLTLNRDDSTVKHHNRCSNIIKNVKRVADINEMVSARGTSRPMIGVMSYEFEYDSEIGTKFRPSNVIHENWMTLSEYLEYIEDKKDLNVYEVNLCKTSRFEAIKLRIQNGLKISTDELEYYNEYAKKQTVFGKMQNPLTMGVSGMYYKDSKGRWILELYSICHHDIEKMELVLQPLFENLYTMNIAEHYSKEPMNKDRLTDTITLVSGKTGVKSKNFKETIKRHNVMYNNIDRNKTDIKIYGFRTLDTEENNNYDIVVKDYDYTNITDFLREYDIDVLGLTDYGEPVYVSTSNRKALRGKMMYRGTSVLKVVFEPKM